MVTTGVDGLRLDLRNQGTGDDDFLQRSSPEPVATDAGGTRLRPQRRLRSVKVTTRRESSR